MSLDRCIVELEAAGTLTAEQAAAAREVYGRHQRRLRQTLPREAADARASEEAVASIERAAQLAKVQKLLQLRVQERIIADLASYRGDNRSHAAQALFDHDQLAPYMNVEALRKIIVGGAHRELTGLLVRHRRNLIGSVRHKDDLSDAVRELFGQKTGNANAAEIADAFRRVAEGLRQRYNAAGGAIGKLEGWGLAQRHNAALVRAAGFDAWRGFVAPRLDRQRMVDRATGRPLDDESLNALLRDVWDTIRTDGWIDRPPGGTGGAKKLANQRGEHRVLHFADADGWLGYQARFGDGGDGAAYDAMIGHVEGMARDIAHMEVLGPNPAATLRWLKDSLVKEGNVRSDASEALLDSLKLGAHRLDTLYAATSGQLNTPVSTKWARRFGTVRSLHVAQMLGSAFISSITDVGFQAMTRGFNGLPVTRTLTGYLKYFRPTMTPNQQAAVRLGLIAQEAASMGAAQQRYLGESISHEWSRRLADTTLRVTALSPWTQAGRWAFGMEFLGALREHAGKGWNELGGGGGGRPGANSSDPDELIAAGNRALRDAMERYGITESDWDVIRRATPYEHRGADFVDFEAVAQKDRGVAEKMMAMILTETEYAVPAAGVRTQSLLSMGQQPGTLGGELVRNMALFKTFGVSVLLNHGARAMAMRPMNGALYAAGMTVTMTLLGALALQLSEIVKTRDPAPMDDPNFWGRAMLKGGGFGIFGDLLAAGTSERGVGEMVAGPVFGTVSDAFRLATGRMSAGDAVQRYTPVIGSNWYLRGAYERLVIDELRRQTDANYDQSRRRVERRMEARGQDFWWRPGATAPERAPDLSNAFIAPPPKAAQ